MYVISGVTQSAYFGSYIDIYYVTTVLVLFSCVQLRLNILSDIVIYTQQDATLHSLFYLETALYVSGGTTTHHQERKQLYLQHLVFVTPLLLPAAIAAGSSSGV
jgi:hypothetical protein